MRATYPHIHMMGERSILIEFEPEISENLLTKLLFFKKIIQKEYFQQKVEVMNTYSSLLIIYHDDIEDIYSEVLVLKLLVLRANIDKKVTLQIIHIPVCYDQEFGLDLELVSLVKKLSVEEIIRLHTFPVYTVYFIGFLPGFLYLGGLDEKLQISRKTIPRPRVEKGAVGIGEKQTGIYPKISPGGWQIIGNSPIEIFDKNSNPPCQISAGDKIKFYPVVREEFEDIKFKIGQGKFKLKIEKL